MSDSRITKQVMADALKALLREEPFERISVSDLCEYCHMNRKSFYYHFRDKNDLVNWIFDTELQSQTQLEAKTRIDTAHNYEEYWEGVELLCRYFYDNRIFYRSILKIEGQNPFKDHFREVSCGILREQVQTLLGTDAVHQMVYDFVVDGMICAIERWLLDRNCISTDQFVENLQMLIRLLAAGMKRRSEEDPKWME